MALQVRVCHSCVNADPAFACESQPELTISRFDASSEDDINDIMVELDAAIGAADTAINEVISGGDGRAAKDAIKKVSIKMRDFDTEAIAVIEDKSAAATRTFTPSAEGVPAGTVEQVRWRPPTAQRRTHT